MIYKIWLSWPFRSKAQQQRFNRVKAEFEARGIHIETRSEAIWEWLRGKWDRFGTI